jgi:uncharacterized membrane protein
MNDELKFTYILMMILILSFVFNPFFKKKAVKNIKANEYLIINHILITTLVLIYASYLFYNNQCDLSCFTEMSKTQMTWAMLAALTSLIGAMALIMLVSRDEVTFIMPNVQPLVLLIGAIIGYFIFKESMRFYKMLGIFLVVIGAVFINIDKIQNSS